MQNDTEDQRSIVRMLGAVLGDAIREQDGEDVFRESRSLVFKRLRVVRMVDARRNALVYLTYSDRVIEGSPQNAVTAVPVDRATPIPLR